MNEQLDIHRRNSVKKQTVLRLGSPFLLPDSDVNWRYSMCLLAGSSLRSARRIHLQALCNGNKGQTSMCGLYIA